MLKFITTRLRARQDIAVQRAAQAQAEADKRAAFDAESARWDIEVARHRIENDKAWRVVDAAFADPLIAAANTHELN
ncbi:hypothetical protein SAMN05216466_10666 [Paraburkholderia phenazinium]|uniref:Uncharacterized protein n=1 Tax=Paraburkholderia phenazinium TaxID=60549 RepID=A0A1G7Y7N2_9BURK|nr:hypothetical protein [Paraburkholderia phenazinium]SDG92306.1 hypothetical protein SAMN05216466_10666 [Paraburkholderia phenazinium]